MKQNFQTKRMPVHRKENIKSNRIYVPKIGNGRKIQIIDSNAIVKKLSKWSKVHLKSKKTVSMNSILNHCVKQKAALIKNSIIQRKTVLLQKE
jgi:hypothetical protein